MAVDDHVTESSEATNPSLAALQATRTVSFTQGRPMARIELARLLDAFAEDDRRRIVEWLTQAEARGRLGQAMKALQEGRWFVDE